MSAAGLAMARESFQDLPNVPDIHEIHPCSHAEARSELPGLGSDVRSVASDAFKQLVEQLVVQHVKELTEARRPRMNKASAAEFGDGTRPPEPKQPPEVLPMDSGTKSFTGSKAARRELQAKELLEALEDSMPMTPMTDKDAIPDIVSKFDTTGKVVEEILSQTRTAPQMQDWSEMDKTEMSFGEQLYWWLQSSRFEMLIICLLCANIFWMALELQIAGSFTAFESNLVPSPSFPQEAKPALDEMLQIGDIIFSGLFLLEVSIRIICLGKQFWKVLLNYADLAVSLVSAVEVISTLLVMPVSPVLVRILRLGKLARVIRLISMGSVLQSLQLLLKSLMSSIDMLFWSFCLLAFLQCVAGLVVSTLCREYLADATVDADLRDQVFRYFGTFTRTFLTMFEVLFANWGPPCRVLVENISEWFALFFLFYRCVIGFAVLNVVGAVFIQQTLKTAHSDEELAYRQKEKEIQAYTRKVRKLFQSMDDSGDGALNLEEFSKLVTSPKLSFWMSQLELEYHDLLSLFEFLDDGDGQITLAEFIEGSARFRGGAKALDIWRLETKVEVLFEEMLNLMHTDDPEVSSYVQRAFTHSAYSHMKSSLRRAEPKG